VVPVRPADSLSDARQEPSYQYRRTFPALQGKLPRLSVPIGQLFGGGLTWRQADYYRFFLRLIADFEAEFSLHFNCRDV
jgi:hypothetical protein